MLMAAVAVAAGQGVELGRRVMRGEETAVYSVRAEGEQFVWLTVAAPGVDGVGFGRAAEGAASR